MRGKGVKDAANDKRKVSSSSGVQELQERVGDEYTKRHDNREISRREWYM